MDESTKGPAETLSDDAKIGNVAEDETFGAIASSAFYGYRGKWQWKGRQCDHAFTRLTEMLAQKMRLVHNDPSKPISLAADASPYGHGLLALIHPAGGSQGIGRLIEECAAFVRLVRNARNHLIDPELRVWNVDLQFQIEDPLEPTWRTSKQTGCGRESTDWRECGPLDALQLPGSRQRSKKPSTWTRHGGKGMRNIFLKDSTVVHLVELLLHSTREPASILNSDSVCEEFAQNYRNNKESWFYLASGKTERHLKAQRGKRMLFILLCAFALPVSADRYTVGNWTMETPDQVMGRMGKPVVLYCKFIHPHHDYKGNISIIWSKKNANEPFFKYINYPSGDKYINEILSNEGSRYKPMGNPRKNDASIIINQLEKKDTGKKLNCRVELTGKSGANFGRSLFSMQGDNVRASMVIGRKNGTATLPCSFSPSIRNPSSITIRWMKGSPREESTVFNHSSTVFNHSVNPPYNVPIKGGGRYELVGKLDQGDASIRVKELRLNDSSDYFCHVWVRNSTQETVTQDETKLEVVVPATILELFFGSSNVTGEKTLVCRAEGKPPANITWIGPGNSTLPMNSSEMRVTHDPEKLLTVGELLHPRMPGNYTCVAVNEHQRDTREIRLHMDRKWLMQVLCFGLSILAIALLVMVFVLRSLKKGSQQRWCGVDACVANGREPQGPEPGSQEPEGDPVYSVVHLNTWPRNRADTQAVPTPGELDRNVDPRDSPDPLIYSIVHVRRRSQVGAEMDPAVSQNSLYSNVHIQRPPCKEEETGKAHGTHGCIYATVVSPKEQLEDASGK
ncbi:uncharacterized protein LOC144611565 [Rhinoraja longicauda]